MGAFEMLRDMPWALQAMIAAAAVGLVCSLLSVVVVLKRMAFIGQGISHAGFGGVGLAVVLGYTGEQFRTQHDLIVFTFCLATAIGIGLMTRRRKVQADTAIGIVLAATMAFGVVAQNLRAAWTSPTMSSYWPAYHRWLAGADRPRGWEEVLFGSMFNVGSRGMWLALVVCVVVVLICAALYKELLFYTFDESVSRVFGVRSAFLHYLLLVLLTVVVVVSIRLVGLILVSAMLIMPGAAALLLSRKMHVVLVLAAIIGVGASVGGLLLALQVGTLSPGACIVVVLAAAFVASYLIARLAQRSAAATAAATA